MKTTSLNYDEANFVSKWLFWWAVKLFKSFRSTPVTPETLPEVPHSLEYDPQLEALSMYWAEEVTAPKPSFVRALFRAMGKEYIKASLIAVIPSLCALSQVVVMNLLVEWLRDSDAELYVGVTYLLAFAFLGMLWFIATNKSLLILMFVVSKAKNFVAFTVVQKLLKVSYDTLNSGNTSATMTNLIGTDLELLEMLNMAYQIWVLPVFIVGGIGLLWLYMGLAGLVGMGIILLHLLILLSFAKLTVKLRLAISVATDRRVKLITNLIEGIKLVKLYTWEQPFLTRVFWERSEEIRVILKLGLLTAMLMLLYYGLMGVSVYGSLWVYIELYGEISVENAFAGLAVLYICSTYVIGNATLGIRSMYIFLATCQRITDALLLREVEPRNPADKNVVGLELDNASFSWSQRNEKSCEGTTPECDDTLLVDTHQEFILTDVTFKAKPGELVVVTGPVGSGKTTLLVGILREIHLTAGLLYSTSSFAYVPGTSWVIPGTIQENVIMGRPFDSVLYSRALQISDLGKDVEVLENKDATIVGENSLSGGQKARLGLARAVYSDSELYLLDDPLSAVDSAVSARIFKNLKELTNAGKTIVMATHQTQTLPYADRVVLLYKGRQVYCGEYKDLGDTFAGLIGETTASIKQKKVIDDADHLELGQPAERMKIYAEQSSRQSLSFAIYTRFLSFAYKNPLVFLPIGVVLLVSQAIILAVYYWVSTWSAADDQAQSVYPLVFGIIVLASYVFGFIRYFLVYYSLIRANQNIHNTSLESLVYTDAHFFDENSPGVLLNRFTKDTAVIDENLLNYFAEAVNNTLVLVGTICLIVVMSPGTLVGLCVYAALLAVIIRALLPVTKNLRMIEITSRGPLLSVVNSTINGLLTIRNLGVQRKFVDEMRQATRTNLKALLAFYSVLGLMQFTAELGAFVILLVNAVSVVVMKDWISPEMAAATLALTVSLNGFSSYWSKLIISMDNYMLSPQRLDEFCQLEPELTGQKPIHIHQGAISFKEVYAKYAPGLPYALKGLTVDIPAQAKVGIIGRTGAGKSSLMQVLFRLITPESGTIYIDNQDYLQADLTELRSSMSVIPQFPLIFRGTVTENIDPFGDYDRNAIADVLAKVELLEFLNQQPNGLDSVLDSDDVNLSAGQKQLICLARAIMKQSKIVVMDEATANVDNLTDKMIQRMVRESFAESTLLVIAHRLRTIIDSELIMVMDAGECVEFDTPAVLASRESSVFSRYIEHTGPEEAEFLRSRIDSFKIPPVLYDT